MNKLRTIRLFVVLWCDLHLNWCCTAGCSHYCCADKGESIDPPPKGPFLFWSFPASQHCIGSRVGDIISLAFTWILLGIFFFWNSSWFFYWRTKSVISHDDELSDHMLAKWQFIGLANLFCTHSIHWNRTDDVDGLSFWSISAALMVWTRVVHSARCRELRHGWPQRVTRACNPT